MSPDSATGALLEDLRQRAGIAAPGAAVPTRAPAAPRAASLPGPTAQPGGAAEMDPELKEALKETRDLVKESLTGLASQEVGLSPTGQAQPGEISGRRSASLESTSDGTEIDPAVRRAELAAAQPAAPPRPAEAPGPEALIPALIQAVRDLLLHPATWLALALVLLLKLAWALAAIRSRRRLHRRRHSRGSARSDPAARAGGAPAVPPTSAPLPTDRSHRTSRHGQRQRRQQQ